MERDAAISHGASSFLRERLMLVSDKYTVAYCRKCGQFAVNSTAPGTSYRACPLCNSTEFGKCTIPYAYKLLVHLLAAPGINLRPEFMTSSEYYDALFNKRQPKSTNLDDITTEFNEEDAVREEEEQEIAEEEVETNYDDIYDE
jgi:hypothetical protein